MRVIKYTASPTAQKFHASNKVVRGFKGPVGNGKSVCCIQEGLRLSMEQAPNSEGIRKSRGVIVRNTSIELRTTTLKTWKQWIPEAICPVVMSPAIVANLRQKLDDDTWIELEIIFLAVDKDDDVKKMLSMEVTWCFLNEAKELPWAVVKAARERIGRYPSAIDGYEDVYQGDDLIYDAPKQRNQDGTPKLYGPEYGDLEGDIMYSPCTRKALLMDTNPPEDDHWWYQLAEEGVLRSSKNKDEDKEAVSKIFDFFDGPPPLYHVDGKYIPNPDAENISHLPGGYDYYMDMIAGNTQDHINVMVLGNYGAIKSGKPVYPSYNDNIHCPKEFIKLHRDLPICFGWDFGLTPGWVAGQMTTTGQLRILCELWSEDMDIRRFARDIVKPFIGKHFKDMEIGFSLADGSGNNRGEGEGKSAIGILNDDFIDNDDGDIIQPLDMGFTTEAAPTNDPTKRIDAVCVFLNKMVDGDPGYVLNKACTLLRKGKNGSYCYQRVAVAGTEERYRDKPNKNKYSHTSDAEQYLALGFVGGYVVDHSEEWYEDEYSGDVDAMGY